MWFENPRNRGIQAEGALPGSFRVPFQSPGSLQEGIFSFVEDLNIPGQLSKGKKLGFRVLGFRVQGSQGTPYNPVRLA